MQPAMILFVEPFSKEAVEFFKVVILIKRDQRQKAVSDGAPEAFDFAARGAVIGFRVDQGNAEPGGDELQVRGCPLSARVLGLSPSKPKMR